MTFELDSSLREGSEVSFHDQISPLEMLGSPCLHLCNQAHKSASEYNNNF